MPASPSPPQTPAVSVEDLYRANHDSLRAWLRRRLRDTDTVADLVHDVFTRILVKPQVLETVREPRAYLVTIARGVLNDHHRRQALERAWLDTLRELPEALVPCEETRLIALQTLHELDALLSRLPPKARGVFVLSQMEGLSYAQIAERLDIGVRSVQRYMTQSFEAVLTLMDD
ncbi:sigma-70 family RNA polymerase sigma factor [Pseudothauera nasutitermitis]|uniref:Sigma-70 family RNA polymerase sigma factor n=1 Tax=Pseudothauera nasutitermitis TaxID=2565930 RepID=A0A4S4B6M9_9RHOO|nr:sigma-70 family RNA polymerase sigma factor [Pseudothauera nasutitermitis]THF66617.1 sigma-70 family RNA polymerase sigma factor [Pseudothauera nasutitermitis]